MTQPKISVIIPVYNCSKYLKKCLDSVINQTYKQLEIILINDGSTDESPEICKKYAEKDNRIIYVSQENGGPSKARNAGLTHATGDYIDFIDSDDFLELDAFSSLADIIEQTDCDMVFYEYSKDFPQQTKIHKLSDEWYGKMDRKKAVELAMQNPFIWNKLIKREITTLFCFNESYYRVEDTLFLMQCVLDSNSFYSCSQSFYHYVQSDSSICRSKFKATQLTGLDANDDMIKLILQKEPQVLSKMHRRYLNFCLVLWGDMKKSGYNDKNDYALVRKKFLDMYKKADKNFMSKKDRLKYMVFRLSPDLYMLSQRD